MQELMKTTLGKIKIGRIGISIHDDKESET
jgi:hypothetical protein